MAIEVKIRSDHDAYGVRSAIVRNLERSRFDAEVRVGAVKRRERKEFTAVITVHDVRLKQSKHFCGSHPAACENPIDHETAKKKPFGGGKTKYLEGADWVAFNDLLNDTLDALVINPAFKPNEGVNADIGSFVCEIRRGKQRRVRYGMTVEVKNLTTLAGREEKRTVEWEKSGSTDDYADYCGKEPPQTIYPEGTPGIPTWRADEDVKKPDSTPVPAPAGAVATKRPRRAKAAAGDRPV